MSRPIKTGLDYFPFDVDFFQDEKIEAISVEFGIKGEIATIKLLCAIYRNGYFILWNDRLKIKLLKNLPGVSSELLEQIVNRLCKWGFFDEALFTSVKVLTSKGIQNRFFSITKRRQKIDDFPYLLLETEKCNNRVNVCNNSINVCNNSVNACNKYTKERKENIYNPPLYNPPPLENHDAETEPLPPATVAHITLATFRQQVTERPYTNVINEELRRGLGLGTDTATLEKWLDEYIDTQTATGNTRNTFNEYRKHFANWARIKKQSTHETNEEPRPRYYKPL